MLPSVAFSEGRFYSNWFTVVETRHPASSTLMFFNNSGEATLSFDVCQQSSTESSEVYLATFWSKHVCNIKNNLNNISQTCTRKKVQCKLWKQTVFIYMKYISISIYVYLCKSMYIYVYLCISMYIYEYLCLSMSIYVYLCLSIYLSIYLSIHLPVRVEISHRKI